MPDSIWIFMLLAFCHAFQTQHNTERINDMTIHDKTIRENFEEVIRNKLANPDIPASEVETLARAYSELTKNDNLKEMIQNVGCAGYGAPAMVSGNEN